MDQLEEDLRSLEDIAMRIFDMSQQLAGTYDTTEFEVERREAIYRSGDRLRRLIADLKDLQRILRREGKAT